MQRRWFWLAVPLAVMCAAGVVGAATQEPGGDAASVWVVIFVGAFVLGAMLIAWFVASDAQFRQISRWWVEHWWRR